MNDLKLEPKAYLLTTIHRPYNTDIEDNLRNIFQAFAEMGEVIIFPAHPRTTRKIAALESAFLQGVVPGNTKMIAPVGYLDMLVLEENSRLILTDSGGMQKEAYFFGVPCITLRSETEWIETVEVGWNVLAGSDTESIFAAYERLGGSSPGSRPTLYGDGRASLKILKYLVETT